MSEGLVPTDLLSSLVPFVRHVRPLVRQDVELTRDSVYSASVTIDLYAAHRPCANAFIDGPERGRIIPSESPLQGLAGRLSSSCVRGEPAVLAHSAVQAYRPTETVSIVESSAATFPATL